MRKVQEVLRLLLVCGLSQRQVSRVCGIARASVGDYLARAQRAGLVGTPLEGWSEEDLDRRLYPSARRLASLERPVVAWVQVHEELKLKNVTLSLVWQEYRERQPDGYQYDAGASVSIRRRRAGRALSEGYASLGEGRSGVVVGWAAARRAACPVLTAALHGSQERVSAARARPLALIRQDVSKGAPT
jgi:hypothetical protein